MALLASGIAYTHREVLLRDKPAQLLAVSPKATVPVLVLADGTVIDESIDIMHWALTQHDPEGWLGRADAALVAAFDDKFKYHLDRYKYATRHNSDPLEHRAAGLTMLADLGARLAGRNFIGGPARGFSDIAIFPFVRQFAGVDAAWFAGHAPAAVQTWLGALLASLVFEQAMAKHICWSE